jgi:hypothetical protein
LKNTGLDEDNAMKHIIATTIVLLFSVLFAAALPAKESYAPGLGEFMTQVRQCADATASIILHAL